MIAQLGSRLWRWGNFTLRAPVYANRSTSERRVKSPQRGQSLQRSLLARHAAFTIAPTTDRHAETHRGLARSRRVATLSVNMLSVLGLIATYSFQAVSWAKCNQAR